MTKVRCGTHGATPVKVGARPDTLVGLARTSFSFGRFTHKKSYPAVERTIGKRVERFKTKAWDEIQETLRSFGQESPTVLSNGPPPLLGR